MAVENSSPEANYLTRSNIVHPLSTEKQIPLAHRTAVIAAAETRARTDLQGRKGVSVSGGSIPIAKGTT